MLLGGCSLSGTAPQTQTDETTEAGTEAVTETRAANTAPDDLAEDACGQALTWELTSGGTLRISGEGDMYDFPDAPWSPERQKIYRIEVGDGVTGVGENAFANCDKAYGVTLPDTLERLGNGAFSGCAKLSSVRIPDGVETIGERCFESCNTLWSVTLPEGLREIGVRAFNLCDRLSDAKLPDGLETIGDEAFAFCERISSFRFPASLTKLGKDVFVHCTRLSRFTVDEENPGFASDERGVLYTKKMTTLLVFPYAFGDSSYTVSDMVREIGEGAFAYCDGLRRVTIPDTVDGRRARAVRQQRQP